MRYRHWQSKTAWINDHFDEDRVDFGESSSAWSWHPPDLGFEGDEEDRQPSPLTLWGWPSFLQAIRNGEDISPYGEGPPTPTPTQFKRIEQLARVARWGGRTPLAYSGPLFAAAPVRSKPHRTYNPSPYGFDSEGSYVPMYLADIFFRQRKTWESMKVSLEKFGRDSGLFDEITIRPFGGRESAPFQVQIRKSSNRIKGPKRNFIDVGYGVSQALPILTELFRKDSARTFLLQQPEVHLHPSAQAALGTLFCQLAGQGRQLLVETHSDHLIERIRMDVRDGTTKLKPKDVSILYFERGNIDVNIHSLRIDQEGNILGAPASYRQFFMAETRRSLKL